MKIVRLFTLLLSLFIFGCSDDNGKSQENDNAEYYTLNMKQQFHLVIRVMEFFILLPLKMAQKFLLIKSH